jgi:hypothetical protein
MKMHALDLCARFGRCFLGSSSLRSGSHFASDEVVKLLRPKLLQGPAVYEECRRLPNADGRDIRRVLVERREDVRQQPLALCPFDI